MEDRSYKKGTTVSTDDITVHQLYTDDELAVPAIVLKLVSNRDDSATIRLRVPEPTAQRVGFHPDFENDAWEITDDGLLFETTLEPETEITTLYAVETEDEAAVGEAMDTLEIESVDAVADKAASSQSTESADEEVTDPDETLVDVTGEAPETEADSDLDPDQDLIDLTEGEKAELATDFDLGVDEIDTEVTMEDTAEESEDDDDFDDLSAETNGDSMDDSETLDEQEQSMEEDEKSTIEPDEQPTTGKSEVSGESAEGDVKRDSPTTHVGSASEDTEAGVTGVSSGDSLAEYSTDALVEELAQRAGNEELSDAAQEQLATLGEEDSRGAVRDAQIANLQSRIGDVEAFTDTLEDVLEQHGPPAAVLAEYDERLTAMESELETVSDEVSDTTETVATIEPKVSDLESGLAAVESDIETVDEDVKETREEIDAVQTDVDEVAENQEALESDVKTLQEWRGKITGALEAFTGE